MAGFIFFSHFSSAGYHTVTQLAHAEVGEVEEVLRKAGSFQSEKKQEGETEWERLERRKARCIWLTGRKGVTEAEAAQTIVEEAKAIVEGELGVGHIEWGKAGVHEDGEKNTSEEGEKNTSHESNKAISKAEKGIVTAMEENRDFTQIQTAREVNGTAKENKAVREERLKNESGKDSAKAANTAKEETTLAKNDTGKHIAKAMDSSMNQLKVDVLPEVETEEAKTKKNNILIEKNKSTRDRKMGSRGDKLGAAIIAEGSDKLNSAEVVGLIGLRDETFPKSMRVTCDVHLSSVDSLNHQDDTGEHESHRSEVVPSEDLRREFGNSSMGREKQKSHHSLTQKKHKSLEKSFFGQVVLSPPPGVSLSRSKVSQRSVMSQSTKKSPGTSPILAVAQCSQSATTKKKNIIETVCQIGTLDDSGSKFQLKHNPKSCNSVTDTNSMWNDSLSEFEFNDSFVFDSQTVKLGSKDPNSFGNKEIEKYESNKTSQPQVIANADIHEANIIETPQSRLRNHNFNLRSSSKKKYQGKVRSSSSISVAEKRNDKTQLDLTCAKESTVDHMNRSLNVDIVDCTTPTRGETTRGSFAEASQPLFDSEERTADGGGDDNAAKAVPHIHSNLTDSDDQNDLDKNLELDNGISLDLTHSSRESLVAASNYDRLGEFDSSTHKDLTHDIAVHNTPKLNTSVRGRDDFASPFDYNTILERNLSTSDDHRKSQCGNDHGDNTFTLGNKVDSVEIQNLTQVTAPLSDTRENEELLLAALGESFDVSPAHAACAQSGSADAVSNSGSLQRKGKSN